MNRILTYTSIIVGTVALLSCFDNCTGGFTAVNLSNGSSQSASTSMGGPTSPGMNTSVPTILGVSQTFTQGSTVTIVGSGFGTRSSAKPVYFSDFDSYPLNDSALNTGLSAPMGTIPNEPYIDNTRAVSGAQSLRMDYPLNKNGEFPEVMLQNLSLTQVYVSAWIYWERTAGSGAGGPPIFKLVRAEANPPYHGYPGFYETIFPNAAGQVIGTDRGSVASDRTVTYGDTINAGQTSGVWHRIDYYYKLSTPGVADGVFESWVDGVLNANIQNTMSRLSGSTATINDIISPFDGISNYGISNSYSLWVDNFYVDSTQARVELGDAPTFAGCKTRYIQPSTAWDDGAVAITVNLNQFTSGEKVYLYIVSPDGNVNNNGYPVTVGGS